mmetsp:Transcript_57305/g.131554  ORF Transcript_57305/g.131554 Transcript_57305/m.131554 type:complete len:345 (+) Transcript_57305:201-1235(+)
MMSASAEASSGLLELADTPSTSASDDAPVYANNSCFISGTLNSLLNCSGASSAMASSNACACCFEHRPSVSRSSVTPGVPAFFLPLFFFPPPLSLDALSPCRTLRSCRMPTPCPVLPTFQMARYCATWPAAAWLKNLVRSILMSFSATLLPASTGKSASNARRTLADVSTFSLALSKVLGPKRTTCLSERCFESTRCASSNAFSIGGWTTVNPPYCSSASMCCVAGSLRSSDAVPPCTRKLSRSGSRSALRLVCSITCMSEPNAQPATLAHTCLSPAFSVSAPSAPSSSSTSTCFLHALSTLKRSKTASNRRNACGRNDGGGSPPKRKSRASPSSRRVAVPKAA